ncbi:BCCT family transporter [Pseudomonas guariconensis]|uniref:BCCT family transporter n=1 Tax=Pseudomonas guariconensis TaxID=1288410 RepID=UPI0018A8F481|nr:BCCT family transporter [Pseudomonas guariconensis]MBF8753891.1 BCCT family transporter [Pseudomonas guariconensis]
MKISASATPALPDGQVRTRKDTLLIVVSVVSIFLTVFALAAFPARSEQVASQLFQGATDVLAAPVLLVFLAFVVGSLFIIFSKYGNVRLGSGKPQFKTLPWVFMFICAGLSSATLYWGLVEWAFYYNTPGLNIAARSPEALDMSIAYAFFHWGFGTWACYAVGGMAMAYYYHVRKHDKLSLAGIIEAVTGFKASGPIGRLIDIIFLIGTFGGLTVTMVVTTQTFSNSLSNLTGLPNTFAMQAGIVLVITSIFSLSSYIGLEGGMQRLASMVCWGALFCALAVLVVGPTGFIVKNTVNGVGLMFSNFLHMSLFTDPAGDGEFTRNWTVFYWFWAISYTPAVSIFVARVSRGRTLKEVAAALLLGGSVSCWAIFGSLSGYGIDQLLKGVLDVPAVVANQGGEVAITQLLNGFPMSGLATAFYLFVMVIFLASHIDASAYTVAAATTRNLPEGRDPSPFLRLFWCVMLALVPLTMIANHLSLKTVKTSVILTSIPFFFLLLVMAYGFVRWLYRDYRHRSVEDIEAEARQLGGEGADVAGEVGVKWKDEAIV